MVNYNLYPTEVGQALDLGGKMDVKGVDPNSMYSVTMHKKVQDQEKEMGAQQVRLIEGAAAGPQEQPPGPNSTVHVVA